MLSTFLILQINLGAKISQMAFQHPRKLQRGIPFFQSLRRITTIGAYLQLSNTFDLLNISLNPVQDVRPSVKFSDVSSNSFWKFCLDVVKKNYFCVYCICSKLFSFYLICFGLYSSMIYNRNYKIVNQRSSTSNGCTKNVDDLKGSDIWKKNLGLIKTLLNGKMSGNSYKRWGRTIHTATLAYNPSKFACTIEPWPKYAQLVLTKPTLQFI